MTVDFVVTRTGKVVDEFTFLMRVRVCVCVCVCVFVSVH